MILHLYHSEDHWASQQQLKNWPLLFVGVHLPLLIRMSY